MSLSACGSDDAKPAYGGVSEDEAAELDQAAETVEARSGNPSSGVPEAAQPRTGAEDETAADGN